jgi:hypothetical protein
VLDFLREYHGALGPLVAEYEGTLDQFSGDGIMVFFNDPVPMLGTPLVLGDAVVSAIRTAIPDEAPVLLGGLNDRGLHELRGRLTPVRIWIWDGVSPLLSRS